MSFQRLKAWNCGAGVGTQFGVSEVLTCKGWRSHVLLKCCRLGCWRGLGLHKMSVTPFWLSLSRVRKWKMRSGKVKIFSLELLQGVGDFIFKLFVLWIQFSEGYKKSDLLYTCVAFLAFVLRMGIWLSNPLHVGAKTGSIIFILSKYYLSCKHSKERSSGQSR